MTYIVRMHLPCSNCGSSDALTDYGTHTHCFACSHHENKIEMEFLPWRGVTKETMRFFNVKTKVDQGESQEIHFSYNGSGTKVRSLKQKDFKWMGEKDAGLFGQDRFNAGQAQYITITEGELDCLSVFQMLGSKYPVVSVRSASSARKDCEKARDYLNSFDRIYICFDNDNPGNDAAKDVAMLFDLNKVYYVQLGKFKDPNEFLTNNADKEFSSVWWNSKKYKPRGIVSDWDEIEKILMEKDEEAIATYPFPTLQEMTYGLRSKETVLFTAQEKIGKTEVMRALEYHILKTTDHNIGIIHLEEGEKRSVNGLVTYELKSPVHLPDSQYTVEEKVKAFKDLSRRSDRVHFYSHFGSEDPNVILDVIRALVTQLHCKFVFLDHITMVVTGFETDDERKKLDYISTCLAMMTRELDFCLVMVSHVNDDGKTRGSRNISKVADLIISLDRDIENPDPDTKNSTNLMVKGNRYSGKSGSASSLFFDTQTYTIAEKVDSWL